MLWATSLFLKETNNEPYEKGRRNKEWITTVVHDPAKRQADGI